jgi:hypothetical protein
MLSLELPVPIQNLQTEFCARSCSGESRVYVYKVKKAYYYVLHPGYCKSDIIEEVYNAKGVLLGTLGGITGDYKIQNIDFSKLTFCDSVLWCIPQIKKHK